MACNTATAAAIDFLREKYAPMPIVGMEPAVKPACLNTRSGVVGVLATERSLDGELFRRTAAKYGSGVELITAPGRVSSNWSRATANRRPKPSRPSATPSR